MPKTVTIQDTGDALNKLFADVAQLKQQVTSPGVMGGGGNKFEEVLIGPEGGPWVHLDFLVSEIEPAPGQTAEAPLLLTTGTYQSDIFVDVAWSAPSDNSAQEYEVEMSIEEAPGVFSLSQMQRTGSNNVRFFGLEPNTKYGFRVIAINPLGIRSASIPAEPQTIITGQDATIPPAPTGVIVGRGATSVVVKYTPLTKEQAADVAHGNGTYEVHIATDNLFTSNLNAKFTSDQVTAFNDIISPGTWYARVRAVDSSGNVGPWSATGGPATAGGVVDNMIVSGLDAAKITVGFLSGSRIQADSITADKLTTSTLTSKTITIGSGGAFKIGTPPSNGIFINDQGIRAYKASAQTFSLDSTGTAVFRGTVDAAIITASTISGGTIQGTTYRSAASGPRIEITTNDVNYINLYSSTVYAPGRIGSDPNFVGAMYVQSGKNNLSGGAGSLERSFLELHPPSSFGKSTIYLQPAHQNNGDYGKVGVNGYLDVSRGITAQSILASAHSEVGGVTLVSGAVGTPWAYNNTVSGRNVYVNSAGTLGYLSSSMKQKKHIKKISGKKSLDIAQKILDLDLVSFVYKTDEREEPQVGFIAEWAEKALGQDLAPTFLYRDEDGSVGGIDYQKMLVALIPTIKKLADKAGIFDSENELEKS